MKKFILALLICIVIAPTFILYGCKNSPKNSGLDLAFYFEDKITYQVYNKSSKVETTMKNFSHNNHNDQVQYTNITFTGKPSNLYKMTLEKVTFDIYSNANLDAFQFEIVVSNLAQGDTDLTTSNTLTKEISVDLKKNKTSHVSLEVNDIFTSISASTTIKIVTDASYYKGDYEQLGFKFDVLNFRVFGKHK